MSESDGMDSYKVVTTRRLTMGDVDAVQVYAPNYFRWMDQGIHEYFVRLGHPVSSLLDQNIGTPAVKATCEYFAPVVLDDVLECTTWMSRVGTSSFDLAHEFRSAGVEVASGLMTHVWIEIDEGGQRAVPLPDWLRAAGPAQPDSATAGASDVPEASAVEHLRRPGVAFSRCPSCARVAFPAEPICVACGSSPDQDRSGPTGTLTTWTTVGHAPPGFDAPYVLGWVEMESPSISVLGRVEGDELEGLRSGLGVQVSSIDDQSDEPGELVLLEIVS